MDLIRFSINKPVTILVGIILLVLFGAISLTRLPYQLSPSVVEPEITVTTIWRGATPYEVERDVIDEQEKTLKGIPGLIEMESTSANGQGTITLRFGLGTDLDNALLRVSNKVNEVSSYPAQVEKPVISATGAATSPVIWTILKPLPDNPRSINTYRTFFENEVRQHLERIPGVADLFVGSGTEEEMHVVASPNKLAAYKLTINDLITALGRENVNVSAGTMEVGRRDWRIRTTGEYTSAAAIEQVVIRSDGQTRVRVADVAQVVPGYQKESSVVIHNGSPGIAVGIKPEPGTNILDMTGQVETVVADLNSTLLARHAVTLEWVYDQRFYINSAISLIKKNILYGGILAVVVLLVFLRSLRSTVAVATAIPISVIGTFIFLDLLGRNLNVISLAGIAFAVGMLVDNAIVVIENIDRHRQMGKSGRTASLDGTREVWGAVLASTLTTVAVFLPVVFVQEEAGQLFRDIALAVVVSVSLSLFVSVTVIPTVTAKLYAGASRKKGGSGILAWIGTLFSSAFMALVTGAVRNWFTRLVTVGLLITLAVLAVIKLMPKMEYLPEGNRNFVLSILIPPPALSTEERKEIGAHLFDIAKPHIGRDHDGLPGIKDMFYVGNDGFMLIGAMSTHWDRAAELLPLFQRMIFSIPGMFGVSKQVGIFQNRIVAGRTIDVDISGHDLNRIITAAGAMFGSVRTAMPGSQTRPVPSIELSYPEIRFQPDRERLAAATMSARDLGVAIDVLMDGRVIGDFKQEGKKTIDLVLKSDGDAERTPENLAAALIATPKGTILPVANLAQLEKTSGMTQIRHLERNRTISLQITPPPGLALQEAMEIVTKKVIDPIKAAGLLEDLSVRMSGAADKLTETKKALEWNFVLAALISYLLMAALFANFIYPLIILLTVPLAGAGGFIGLKLLNVFAAPQPMDILTMLGFVILIGVVVNNAILIVHQALNNLHLHGMDYRNAVLESTKSRLRPIYMSATTSVFGMLPLVVMPGAGSELYRGLGSVILGGITVSTVFTVFVIPSILMFVIKMEKPLHSADQDTIQ